MPRHTNFTHKFKEIPISCIIRQYIENDRTIYGWYIILSSSLSLEHQSFCEIRTSWESLGDSLPEYM